MQSSTRRFLGFWFCVLTVTVALTASAGEGKPAVSEVNTRLSASLSGAKTGGGAGWLVIGGGYTVPLGEAWGSRLDLEIGVGGNSGGGVAEAAVASVGIFWRRPEHGFVEFQIGDRHFGSLDRYNADFLGGWYLGAWDVEGGVTVLDSSGGYDVGALVGIGGYGNPNLRFSADLRIGSSLLGELKTSWQPQLDRNLIFEFSAGGGTSFYQATVAVALYFGESRTLREKIREDF